MSSLPRRNRSTIVPGRKLAFQLALVDAGLADNSFDNYSTRSDRSRKEDVHLNGEDKVNVRDEDENGMTVEETTEKEGGRIREEEEENELSHMDNEEDGDVKEDDEPAPPPAKKQRMHSGLMLMKLPIYRPPSVNTSPHNYPRRNRCPPVRWWLGEEPVYQWNNGCGELIGITDVYIQDKQYMKYKTASPEFCMEQFMKDRKKRRTTRKRKFA